jgi:hypothetical protein
MSNFIIALVRTVVPIVAGWLLAQLAAIGIHLPADIEPQLISALTALFGGLYYAAVAWLERKYKWFGWLLGVARNPEYAPAHRA